MRTVPANFLLAASTEGASKLQVLQPGAQNQNAIGVCTTASCNENELPSPMMRAVTSPEETSLVTTETSLDSDALSLDDDPHAASTTTVKPVNARVRSRRMT
jgi:hypothetical protein